VWGPGQRRTPRRAFAHTAAGEAIVTDAPATGWGDARGRVERAATTPTAAKVAVTMGKPQEYSPGATPAQVAVGPVTFAVVNEGRLLHEMVVVPSAGGAAALK
jgi:hypothetical protein